MQNKKPEFAIYSEEIKNKAPNAADDFKEFALTLLSKINTYLMTANDDKKYSAFEDLKQIIEKKVTDFRRSHFSWFKTFAVILGNVLAALTVVGAIYMIAKNEAIFHIPPTTQEEKARELVAKAQLIGSRITFFDQKEKVDNSSNKKLVSHLSL